MASAEAVPFVKVGGLADVVGALLKHLSLLEHDVCLFLPFYSRINRSEISCKQVLKKNNLRVRLGNDDIPFTLYKHSLPDVSSATVYFVNCPRFFDRDGIYSHPNNVQFEDEGEMWMFFQLAVIHAVEALELYPDVVHVHDFHTALIPALIRTNYKMSPYFSYSKCVLTLHNLLFQGVYDASVLFKGGVSENAFYALSPFEFYEKTNFVKTGMEFSDVINTVSPKYAKELLENPEYSYGLFDVLQAVSYKFRGILNGADYSYWNPVTDPLIYKNYTADTLENKAVNRNSLLKRVGMEADEKTMVCGMVARMTEQKGFKLLLECWEALKIRNVKFIILACGDKILQEQWEDIARKDYDRLYLNTSFNEELAHKILAGVDLFLMPSQFEPCGLSQIYALKYGTPPLAHRTGGLADTIIDSSGLQTGFLFESWHCQALLRTLDRAYNTFLQKDDWIRIQKHGMSMDFSWKKAAENYIKMYYSLMRF
jgi:starch synthase